MSISPARTIAFDVLLRVVKQDAYADDALRAQLDESVKPEDAGLATELVFGVLRWQRLLDHVIDHHLKKPTDVGDVEVRIALRLALYQLAFLDRIPARAAVHESVELVKRARKRSAASFVNAILRKLAGASRPDPIFAVALASLQTTAASFFSSDLPAADRIGILFSHPTWMIERWIRTFGEERTRALVVDDNCVPALSAWLVQPERRDNAERSLEAADCRIQPGRLLRDAWTIEGGNLGASEAVREGWVSIQDEASQAVAALLAVNPRCTVLDLCAAPGGKTLHLARAAGPKGRVIAADLHEHRVRAMRERFERCGVQNVETIALDGTQPLAFERAFGPTLFDRILVDVPCSGTGTLARHPEIRWKFKPDDLADLHDRQAALLRNALALLAPGGRLVYSTCSLDREENELVVREVLGAFGDSFRLADPRPCIEDLLQPAVPIASVVGDDGFFRTFPPEHRTDGFFAAIIERQNLKA